jgi:co-chaperonin GroES (HSP10)
VIVELVEVPLPAGMVMPNMDKQLEDPNDESTWRIVSVGEGFYLQNGTLVPPAFAEGDEVVIIGDGVAPLPKGVRGSRMLAIANVPAIVAKVTRTDAERIGQPELVIIGRGDGSPVIVK